MRKIFKLLKAVIIITLVCLVVRLGILGFLDKYKVEKEELAKFSNYYYLELTDTQKEMYIRINNGVSNLDKKIVFSIGNENNDKEDLERVIEAYYNDHPECFYLPYNYSISNINLGVFKLSILNLDYLVSDKIELQNMNNKLEEKVDEIIKDNITSSMTDYEKELKIHDVLVETTSYYKYEDIDKIPAIKHTAYGALIDHEAVCDGYSKAFMLILKKLDIDTIIVSGVLDNVNHAWNIVNINGEYYHVDVTSDNTEVKTKAVIHTYFNLTEKDILKSHEISNMFTVPKCNSTKYNYYIYEGFYINSSGSLNSKLTDIISRQKNSNILEVRYNENYNSQDLINELYNLDFNLWKTKRYTNVEYFVVNDVYFFEK